MLVSLGASLFYGVFMAIAELYTAPQAFASK